MNRCICIHGHFYQPPRENPWLEEVEVQDSAFPFHDWNERIAAECYGPNAAARILDGEGRIVDLVNNYARISFNVGPTLLSWLEVHSQNVYRAIIEADRESRARFSGHGSAIAQVFNHVIMPLANRADKATQVAWGIRDFEHRFGRPPEGMWLAETAVDVETLEVLAEQGIRFTILAPHQAARVRILGETEWHDVQGGKVDPRQAYVQNLPSGRSIALFFYNGPISRALAFEQLLTKGEHLAHRLLGEFSTEEGRPEVVHIATDGESYGHHSPHGDMALAYALHYIESNGLARLSNYGEFLELHPPGFEVEIVENTSWSCVHGIERWRGDCGCNSGRVGWQQAWRGPLRAALDWLRDVLAPLYEKAAADLVQDPWGARDSYVGIILDRSPERWERFVEQHARRDLSDEDQIRLRKLLELQRNALLMYTSCGWFFDELSGLETVQIIMYAGRVVQLAEDLFARPFEEDFLERLELARGNIADHRDGRKIYEKFVRPATLDWHKIVAHYAVSSLFETYGERTQIFTHTVSRQDVRSFDAGRLRGVIGQGRVSSEVVGDTAEYVYCAVHLGDHNVHCGVSPRRQTSHHNMLIREFGDAFARMDIPEIIRVMDRHFGAATYSFESLFRDEQRKVLAQLLRPYQEQTLLAYTRIYDEQLPMMRFLKHVGAPLPRSFLAAAEFIFNTDLLWGLDDDEPNIENLAKLIEQAQAWGVGLDATRLGFRFSRMLARLAERWRINPLHREVFDLLTPATELARTAPFEVDLWKIQNVYFEMMTTHFASPLRRGDLGEDFDPEWLNQFLRLGELLQIQLGDLKKKIRELIERPQLPDLIREIRESRRIPAATYRLQFHRDFRFENARELVPYFEDLGISDLYASPILQAAPGSTHCYDICDHGTINRELGGVEEFNRLTETLAARGMGLILDTVPNHMSVADASNGWWMDVLENGISSKYAGFFDIDWNPVNPDLKQKVLLPILGDQYGQVLESCQLQLRFERGVLSLHYFSHQLPIAPKTALQVLQLALEQVQRQLDSSSPVLQEFQSILTALKHLPPREELTETQIEERYREKEIIRQRICRLMDACPQVSDAIAESVRRFNGDVERPQSFNLLDQLVELQSYRPAFWRVAMEEINYRRFFDVNELAAIRVEDPRVFKATHQLMLQLLAEGKASGLRIDHPDGLWDPTAYFRRLQHNYVLACLQKRLGKPLSEPLTAEAIQFHESQLAAAPAGTRHWPLYVVAEKILSENEPLPGNWQVAGTTGYDFLAAANGLFVAAENRDAFNRLYQEFLGAPAPVDFNELTRTTKKMIMLVAMVSEINLLSHQLDRLSERNRRYRDFTLNSLTFAMREITACLPVYRTYITPDGAVPLRDRLFIEAAVEEAKERNPRTAEAVFDFIRDTILLRNLDAFPESDRPRLIEWSLRFQQLTGPIMAKGVEDTAFYLYNRLVSLNEVGGTPEQFGIPVEEFHRQNKRRRQHWPNAMLSTSTHDTKRSEDVRARINVLSEIPQQWGEAVWRWDQLNAGLITIIEGKPAPSPNDRYLLYQTLVGTWPATPADQQTFREFRSRIVEYMLKATKEAKDRTSWINPNEEYDAAIQSFIEAILSDRDDDPFRADLESFQETIAFFGYVNSLSQLALKLTSPGIPDFYQGTESWDFSLVDPDNRRPVDFAYRRDRLAEIRREIESQPERLAEIARGLLDDLPDGRAKIYLAYRLLNYRRGHPELFTEGSYEPLEARGTHASHVCAFTRTLATEATTHEVVVVVPRLALTLMGGKAALPLGAKNWGDSGVLLPRPGQGESPPRQYRNLLTSEVLATRAERAGWLLPLADAFRSFPVALLERI